MFHRLSWFPRSARPRSVSLADHLRAPLRWWPFYGLGLLAAALIVGDWLLPVSEMWRTLMLLPVSGVVCALALGWGRSNEELLSSEGIDAKVETDPVLRAMLERAALPEQLTKRARED